MRMRPGDYDSHPSHPSCALTSSRCNHLVSIDTTVRLKTEGQGGIVRSASDQPLLPRTVQLVRSVCTTLSLATPSLASCTRAALRVGKTRGGSAKRGRDASWPSPLLRAQEMVTGDCLPDQRPIETIRTGE